jgi:2-polyprenyl-3-methyl-5-hydroxy-6-metoxy-1,4-benzoquinol methylase
MGAGSITAIDISDQALDRCRPLCDEIKKINIEKEPFGLSSNSFDIVISFEVLEHLYDPAHYLTEMLRVMGDDALLIMSTPNMTSLISRIRMLLGELPMALASDPTHVRFYRKKDIKDLFKKFNLHATFASTSISLNPLNPKSRFRIPSIKMISSLDDSLVFYTYKRKS